jgi:N-acetylneuraminic acid mutarotase
MKRSISMNTSCSKKTNVSVNVKLLFFILIIISSPDSLLAQFHWETESSDGFEARSGHTAAVLDNKIYVMGGGILVNRNTQLQVFDPSTNMWDTPQTSNTIDARDGATSVTFNGKIYLIGGGGNVPSVKVFDPSANKWSTPTTYGWFTQRSGLTSGIVNDKIYTIGGYISNNIFRDSVEVFDPRTNFWSTPATIGTFTARNSPTSSVVNGKIYLIGGNAGNVFINTVEVFDPSTNTWSTVSTTGNFTSRIWHTASVVNDKIYIIGGYDSTKYAKTVDVFDPSTNSWSTPAITGKFNPRSLSASGVVNGNIYVIGGDGYVNGDSGLQRVLNINQALEPGLSKVTPNSLPAQSNLDPAYPNPIFDSKANFTFDVVKEGVVSITISDILGNKVATVLDETRAPGNYEVNYDVSKFTAGVYFVRMQTAGQIKSRQMVLVK